MEAFVNIWVRRILVTLRHRQFQAEADFGRSMVLKVADADGLIFAAQQRLSAVCLEHPIPQCQRKTVIALLLGHQYAVVDKVHVGRNQKAPENSVQAARQFKIAVVKDRIGDEP